MTYDETSLGYYQNFAFSKLFRLESSYKDVAYVKKGKIYAVGKGKCRIFVYAQNGVYSVIQVTVK